MTGKNDFAGDKAAETDASGGSVLLNVVLFAVFLFSGCALPSDCGDLDYPTYGGAWQRTRRDAGRVGSVFDPAGARLPTLSPRDTPDEDDDKLDPSRGILSAPPVELEPDEERQPLPDPVPGQLRSLELDQIDRGPSLLPPDDVR